MNNKSDSSRERAYSRPAWVRQSLLSWDELAKGLAQSTTRRQTLKKPKSPAF